MREPLFDADKPAALLADARRNGRLIAALPEALTPRTMAEGYRVQDRFRAIWPDRLAGWKVGATAKFAQDKFGVSEPFAGPFFAGDVRASPATIPADRFAHLAIESEFAFRFARTLAPRLGPVPRDAIVAAIDAVLPAFEIVSPRFPDLLFGRAPVAAADCGVNGGFVFGEPCMRWHDLDLAAHKVVLDVDGVRRGEGSGASVLGHPLIVLDWFANHLSSRGIALDAGAIVSTGTTTGIVFLAPEETAVADFGSLGRISLTFTGPRHPAYRPVQM